MGGEGGEGGREIKQSNQKMKHQNKPKPKP